VISPLAPVEVVTPPNLSQPPSSNDVVAHPYRVLCLWGLLVALIVTALLFQITPRNSWKAR
jgi:hypothetical protein